MKTLQGQMAIHLLSKMLCQVLSVEAVVVVITLGLELVDQVAVGLTAQEQPLSSQILETLVGLVKQTLVVVVVDRVPLDQIQPRMV